MALNATQEALLEGAWALRYCADKLHDLSAGEVAEIQARVIKLRDQAKLLDRLSCADLLNQEIIV